jgi:hypothetical protein
MHFNRDLEKYWTNPQYTFVINETDIIKDECCWVIIGMMQKYTRQKRIKLRVESVIRIIEDILGL